MKESRLRTRGLYSLPGVAVPSGQRCIQLMVPDDPAGVRQALGALYELTHWNNWERDSAHKGTEWAKAWKAALAATIPVGECSAMPQVQFRQLSNCSLEASFDGGTEWVEIFNAYDCGYGAGQDAIQDAIEDGLLGRRGQEPPGGELPAQECHTYHVELQGNGIWHCPVPVSAGFTVHVTNATGGWWPTNNPWRCPNGKSYVLGQCLVGSEIYDPADPLPTAWHGQIVGAHGSTPTWFDPLAGVYQVPQGCEDEELLFQMNDSVLADNAGSIQFDVEICNAGFCYYWNFELDDYDWTICGGYGEYVPGVGFRTTVAGPGYYLWMDKLLPDAQTRVFYKARVHYIQGALGGSDAICWWRGEGNWVRLSDNTALAEGDHTIDMVLYQDGTHDVMLNPSGYGIGPCTIKEIWLWGFGTNPFGEDNCS